MADKPVIFLITEDPALAQDLAAAVGRHGYEVLPVPGVRGLQHRVGLGPFSGVVADLARIPPADREILFAIHKQLGNFALILLDNLASLSPLEALPLRRLPWPFPLGFADQVRSMASPVLFLVDQALFVSRALHNGFQQAGVQAVAFESTVGLVEHLVKQTDLETQRRMTPPPKPKSFWEKLGGGAEVEEPETSLSNVIVAQFAGTLAEAEAFDARVRDCAPGTVCYYVSSHDPVRAAVKCLREGVPAALLREQAGKVGAILVDVAQGRAGPREKPRVILVDNYKAKLEELAQALIAKGYDVVPTMDPEQALQLAKAKGRFDLAIIGVAVAYVKLTAKELAQKLREGDSDLRVIFMVESQPAETVTKRISELVEMGVDGALVKPVEPVVLGLLAEKALESRFRDLEIKRLNKELQETNRQLAQINSFQKKFFAMVAHDVKNPLTAIMGYAEILGLKLRELPTELRYASNIHSAATALNLLISDLVDLAAIESGKLRVNIGAMNLAAVVGEVKARIEVVALHRKIHFSVEVPPALPPLQGDPARIGQVLQNLCTNAIQYTKEGGAVTVKVDFLPDKLVLGVRDTGIGIRQEDLPRVFERFFQSQEAQVMRKAGFGLGLKIAREIVQMHGGEMGVESEFGVGSRFFFTLPVPKK